jgi:hypothetical protein
VRIGKFIGRTGLWSTGEKGLQRMLASGFIHGQKRDSGLGAIGLGNAPE